MNERRPYEDDSYGRHSNPPRPHVPGPRHNGPSMPPPPYGRPPETPRPEPAPHPRAPERFDERGKDHFEPATDQWSYEENTRMIGKLGYVPPEARNPGGITDDSDPTQNRADDRVKYRARKRAKKASPLAKLGVVGIVVLLVAVLGGGIWWLTSGGDDAVEDQNAYSPLEKPCDLLNADVLGDVPGSGSFKVLRNEVDAKTHKTEQTCDGSLGDDGAGGNIQVYAEVFERDASAKNSFEHARKNAEDGASDTTAFTTVDDLDMSAFAVERTPGEGDQTVDYSLHLRDANTYFYTRVSLYDGTDPEQVAQHAKDIAKRYLESWHN